MINTSIITIGDELLIGQVIDTNSAFIAQEMNKAGFAIIRRVAISDNAYAIENALNEEKKHSSIILMTGGLGPTADDITKPVLCKYFKGQMVVNEAALANVQHIFENILKRPFTERNRRQCEVPDNCTVILNKKGTAPGMIFKEEFEGKNITVVSMPGVPSEMKGMMIDDVIPMVTKEYKVTHIIHKTALCVGVGESTLADLLIEFEQNLPPNIKLAYLPNYGMVRLRLSATIEDNENTKIETLFLKMQSVVKPYLASDMDESMESILGKLLQSKGETMSTAESCTGGNIAHVLTSIPGSSVFFDGSIVSYSYKAKTDLLQVNKSTIEEFGAVSEEVVKEMATGALKNIGSDYTIAVSGIMGPGGGMPDKPVGTVWVCVGDKYNLKTHKFSFRFDRALNIKQTTMNALNMLRNFILEK
jgi:nicotinamide-nucleotide amidase